MTTPTFILASGSPRRRELLSLFPWPFEVVKPDVDETRRDGELPYDYVRRLSIDKAHAVAARSTGPAIILAADTIVVLANDDAGVAGAEILGKPADAEEATAMLRTLRARDHLVCTALTLINAQDGTPGVQITRLTRTTVTMRDYDDDEIAAYVAGGDPFDKAGGYAIQHEEFHPVDRIDGSYTNVVGLPTETLRMMLLVTGWLPQPGADQA